MKEMVVTTWLKGTNYIDVWAKLFTSSKKEALGNILHLMEILLVVPVSNSRLERMFTTMNRVHTLRLEKLFRREKGRELT